MALTAVWLLRLGCSGRALPVARLRQLGMVLAAAGLQLGIRLLLRLAVLLGADIPAWLLRPDGPLAAVRLLRRGILTRLAALLLLLASVAVAAVLDHRRRFGALGHIPHSALAGCGTFWGRHGSRLSCLICTKFLWQPRQYCPLNNTAGSVGYVPAA